jgi:hypothetical protein
MASMAYCEQLGVNLQRASGPNNPASAGEITH